MDTLPVIDMTATGINISRLRQKAGLSVRDLQGILKVESDGVREGDTYSYLLETNPAIDVRKIIFNALAKNSWPMMGMENVEAELEDVFVKLIQSTEGGHSR